LSFNFYGFNILVTSNFTNITFILHTVSTICWIIVYFESIRIGFRDKTYCIPFIAIALNINWELVHFSGEYLKNESVVQAAPYGIWFILDVFVLVTFYKYGKKYFRKSLNIKLFFLGSIIVLLIALVFQVLFVENLGLLKGRAYAAFIQNLAMSILFLRMLQQRNSYEGQSLAIASNKLIGTLMPTITFGLIGSKIFNGPNLLILPLGISCFIFDLLYLWLLYQVKRKKIMFIEKPSLF